MPWYDNSEKRYGESGKKGDIGEAIVEEYCRNNNIPFIPRKDPYSQTRLKIDCIVNNTPVDVKANVRQKKVFIELKNDFGYDGWFYTTTAEEIYHVDLFDKSIYKYKVSDMIPYVNEKKKYQSFYSTNGAVLMSAPCSLNIIERLQ